VRAFGTIAIMIFPLVLMLFKGFLKQRLGLVDLRSNFGQIGKFQRGPVFFNNGFKIKIIEIKVTIFGFKSFLWEVESLFYEISIGIAHFTVSG
jgi:hypothetical protein